MTWTPPATIADFKVKYDRDFPFGVGLDSVRDQDIDAAIASARSLYNPALWSDDDERKAAFLPLAAHFLWSSLQGAGGLSTLKDGVNSQGEGLTMSKSVGPASVSYDFPERIRNSPILGQLLKSAYGQVYLQMLMPRLVGGVQIAEGFSEFD